MSLSKREKIMLIFLAITITFVTYYTLLLKPRLEKISKLEEEVGILQDNVDITNKNLSLEKDVEGNYKKSYDKVTSISKDFFPSIIQEKLIAILDEFISDSGIEVLSLNFSDIEYVKLSEELEDKTVEQESDELYDTIVDFYTDLTTPGNKNNSTGNTTVDNEISFANMTTSLYFTATYEDAISFIKNVEENDKKIIVKNINLVKKEDGILTGNIILSFYAVPKLFIQDIEYLRWNYDNDYGKENPFFEETESESSKELSSNPSSPNSGNTSTQEIEFGMWVKPISSDLPTVGLGEFNDRSRFTYVYADNIGIETVDISFKQENDRYYYRYNTKSEAFPKEQQEYREVDVKDDVIEIKIYSAKRNSSNDVAGAKITIENMTDLEVKVIIDDDDKERPRVNIISDEGNVTIIR